MKALHEGVVHEFVSLILLLSFSHIVIDLNQLLSYVCPWPRGAESDWESDLEVTWCSLPPSLTTYGGHLETPPAYKYGPKCHTCGFDQIQHPRTFTIHSQFHHLI